MEIPHGVIPDPRSDEEKAKDWKHIAGSIPITWVELDLNNLQLTSKRIQDGSYSCVFQATASALEKLDGKIISASEYFWRKNYPNEGAYISDAGDIAYNRGFATESISPSQNQSEVVMNQIKQLTTTINATGYRQPIIKDLDQIAEAIEAYGQCIVTYESNSYEYNSTKVQGYNVPAYNTLAVTFGHAVCALQYGLINGVKAVVCRDSAVPSGITIITEYFHYHRNTGALYFLGAKDVSTPQDSLQVQTLKAQLVVLMQQLIVLLKQKLLGR